MASIKKIIAFTSFLIIFQFSLFSDNRFQHLTVKDGLAHTDITGLIQDSSGLLWIGTNGGLQNYDGYRLKSFDYYDGKKSVRLLHNRITGLAIDGMTLWVGTESGLVKMNCNTHKFETYNKLQDDNVIRLLSIDSGRNLWMKKNDILSVWSYDESTNQLSSLHLPSEIDAKSRQSVIAISHNRNYTWICTQNMIFQLKVDNNKVVLVGSFDINKLRVGSPTIQYLSANNNYLFLRSASELYRLEVDTSGVLDTSTMVTVNLHTLDKRIPKMTSAKFIVNGNTFFCTSQIGLIRIDTPFGLPKVEILCHERDNPNSLSSNFLSNLFVDSYNNLWVGTWGNGLNYKSIEPPLFGFISSLDGGIQNIHGSFVKAIEKSDDGKLWILTHEDGLNEYQINKGLISFTNFPEINVPGKLFKTLKFDKKQQNLYVGMMQGLVVYNRYTKKTKWVIGNNSQALLNTSVNVMSIAFDTNGYLWLGTWDKGLFCIKNIDSESPEVLQISRKQAINTFNVSSDRITRVYADLDKNEILLCTDNGLNRLILNSDGSIRKIAYYMADSNNPHSISNNFLSTIDKQNDSIYWVGTLGGGFKQNKLTERFD